MQTYVVLATTTTMQLMKNQLTVEQKSDKDPLEWSLQSTFTYYQPKMDTANGNCSRYKQPLAVNVTNYLDTPPKSNALSLSPRIGSILNFEYNNNSCKLVIYCIFLYISYFVLQFYRTTHCLIACASIISTHTSHSTSERDRSLTTVPGIR